MESHRVTVSLGCLLSFLLALAGTGLTAGANERVSSATQVFERLSHRDFEIREAACRELVSAGASSLEVIGAGLSHADPEIRWRVAAALEEIVLDDDAAVDRAIELLKRHGLKSLAENLVARCRERRHVAAVQKLSELGAALNLPEPELEEAWIDEDGIDFAFEIEEEVELVEIAEGPPAGIEFLKRIEKLFKGADAAVLDALPLPADEAVPLDAAPPAPAAVDADVIKQFEQLLRESKQQLPAEEAADDEPAPVLPRLMREEGEEERIAPPRLEEEEDDDAFVPPPPAMLMPGVAAHGISERWASVVIDESFRGSSFDLATLRNVHELGVVNIQGMQLDNAALDAIFMVPHLQQLHLQRSGFAKEALLKHHRERPEVSVLALGNAIMGVHGSFKSGPCRIHAVAPLSPAYRAGIREGDVIEAVNGDEIRDFCELTIVVHGYRPGDEVAVDYRRQGERRSTRIRLGERS